MRRYNFILVVVFCLLATAALNAAAEVTAAEGEAAGLVVRKESRTKLVSTENGEIVAARVGGDIDGRSYLLHFITMDPNSLFLPVILNSDMVFYVSTGSGKLSWTDENDLKTAYLSRGDVYTLKSGAVFFIQSNLETEAERQRLRITSIFANSNTDLQELPFGPYSSIRDLVLGFDKKVLQAAFKVPGEVVQELSDGAKPPAIIHGGVSKSENRVWDMETAFPRSLLTSRTYNIFELNKKKRKGESSVKLFNLLKEDKDFENRYGWSTTVTKKKLSALKDTNIGLFMVNLTEGSMMGPHWNPTATEIAVVLQGRGMIHVVCSGVWNGTECSDTSFEVEEGDIFVVPKFHPMAQMAFNNKSFVFMGFSTSAKRNHPQFLAGQASVLRTLSKDVLARSFNVDNSTMDHLLASEKDSVILSCVSCAEEELRILEEEREKEREREEEEAREREEERRREEEEEERKREEEEAKRQEEEAAARRKEEEEEEEERKREEEEAKREEEERKRREEEEEAEAARRREEEEREREEEEAKRQEEERQRREEEQEAEAERRREEEEAREREEEEAERQEEEEAERQEEERQRREEEQEAEASRRREEEEARKREEEERRRREEEQEAEAERRREEEEAREREEEEAERQEEERRRREEEEEERIARREEQERRRREEEGRRREEEEEERGRQREEEEERREQRGRRRRSEEEVAAEEERRRQEEERREEEEQGGHEI